MNEECYMSPRNARLGLWLGKFSKKVVKIPNRNWVKKYRKGLGFNKKDSEGLGLVWGVGTKKLSVKKRRKKIIKHPLILNTIFNL